MVLFVEILKWYSVVFISIIEFVFIYNAVVAIVNKEKAWQFIIGIFLYIPLLFLCFWAFGHGYY